MPLSSLLTIGFTGSLLETDKKPSRVLAAVGVKVTANTHWLFAGKVDVQVPPETRAKSPLIVSCERLIVSGTGPLL